MARHQIIYTSCMRGIDGVNDGQQIFSYDQSFQDSKADEIKGLFTYQIPALAPGVIMSEEIARTMPSAFNYKVLKNGNVAVTLNTYLGRDYMGSAGRFGNHLSHSIISDFDDFDVYPCELFGSVSLRSSMEYEEVNNPDPPKYLPVPELNKGYVIEPDSIIEFLEIDENIEYFKAMVCAMLKFPSEKKRLVICDEKEKIIKWIAALQYALPMDIAKRVNFTTYDFDPELSSFQICGVVSEGTHYNVSNYIASGRHYVFDFINQQFSQVERKNDPLLFFLDTAFSYSYDSLTDFHEFILKNTTYRSADENYYAAFYLYNLIIRGTSEVTEEEFEKAVGFAKEYASNELRQKVADRLVDDKNRIDELDNGYALKILGYMLQEMRDMLPDQQTEVKQMIVARVIQTVSDEQITETAFIPVYNQIDAMARSINLSIPAEFMRETNRNALLEVLEQNTELWKIVFVVRIVSDYVKDMRLPVEELYPDRAIGAIYYGIVKMAYASGRENGYTIVECILEHFKNDSGYYVNMTLNMEGCLLDFQLPSQDIDHLWDSFTNYIVETEDSYRIAVCKELLEYDRGTEVHQIYLKRLCLAADLTEARKVFRSEYNEILAENEKYRSSYASQIIEEYEKVFVNKMNGIPAEDGFKMARELAVAVMQMHITADYVQEITDILCKYIPLEEPSVENAKIIHKLCEYWECVLRMPLEGRLLLLKIGMALEKVTGRKSIDHIVDELFKYSQEKADLKQMSREEMRDYFSWIIGRVLEFRLTAEEFSMIYDLFAMTKYADSIFMEYCCKMIYKKCKISKDYSEFAEFLNFMFVNGTEDDQEMVGKYLCKLSKQKLEDLDEEMKSYFKRNRKGTHAWENVKEIATNTNPLLNNLAGLFKRK